jgi:uncharacterized repeat protein (TIGR01451 family)/CSLREA domain-containing protein
MRQRRFWIAVLMLLAIILSMMPAPVAQAQGTTITVNTTVDGLNDGDGQCSLREAIQAANTDSVVDACTTGSGDDTIILPAGTYTLTLAGAGEDSNATGDLDITDDLTINGAGADSTTFDGNRLDRVLHVHSGVAIEINGVKITNGKTPNGGFYSDGGPGGGIYNNGMLTITNSTLSSNTTGHGGDAGLIGWGGDGGAGGGIYNSGTLTITNSTLSSNTTGHGGVGSGFPSRGGDGGAGGGIYNGGTLTITNSTLSSNTTGDGGDSSGDFESGGGDGGAGGGIYNSGTLTVVNSTVSINTTGHGGSGDGYGPGYGGDGGGIYNSGILTVTHSTISNNTTDYGGDGGGIDHINGAINVKNTIIADNTDPTGQTPDCSGTLTSQGYNLVENITGCTIGGDPTGNITGQDPRLCPLADNGGSTQTHALLPSSPAIDAGSCSAVTTDQRGGPRPVDIPSIVNVDDGCDIGAYEVQGVVDLLLTKTVDCDTPNPGQQITYTIVTKNNSDITVTNALISDTLPSGLTFAGPVTLDPPGAGTTGTPPTLVSSLTITANKRITVTFPVTVGLDASGIITNTAAITSTEVTTSTTGSVSVGVTVAHRVYLPLILKN